MARSTNAKKPTGPAEEVEQPMLPIEAPRRQRNRIGKKTIAGKFDPAIARAFAILAVKEDTTIEAMLTEAVLDILQKYKQPIER
ncbi:ribbon-helix-helix domain-containing protein (plasmid) [Sphingobium sp. SJ10-10]|uniref:ribbon-helix-helix domain-containing protein n=1 Tax=Sphingobium sp. SJ10-10 TaxID=3114999 RepID=UPI0033197FBC